MPWVGDRVGGGAPGRGSREGRLLYSTCRGTWGRGPVALPRLPPEQGMEPHPVPARWGGQGDPEGQALVYRLRGRRAAPLGAGSTS